MTEPLQRQEGTFVIQRHDDKLFWAGRSRWVTSASEAVAFPTKCDAVTAFGMENSATGVTLFNAVPFYGAN
jgi:hypothetical protein